jgi:predicted nuclease of predicted toxin-antitoxin system
VNFLVDAQLPTYLSDWLNDQGHNSIHNLSLPAKNKTSDVEILRIAEREDRILISKDTDFIESFLLYDKPKKLFLITTGNISNPDLLKLFELNQSKILNLFNQHSLLEMNKQHLIVHR